MTDQGASQNERLLYAAREDDTSLMESIFGEGNYDINFQDGLGNTALHYAASSPSPDALEVVLEHDGTDVDLQNRTDGDTPLHLACKLNHPDARFHIVSSLLDAGADPRIRNKSHTLPVDLLRTDETELRHRIKVAEAELAVDQSQVVAQDDDDAGSETGGHSGEE